MTWDNILTGDNLQGRGLHIVGWCIICRCNGKTVDHLLLYCEKAYRLWSLVFRSFGISWVLPRSIADTLFSWWNWYGKHSSGIWNLVPLCLMWWGSEIDGLLRTWKNPITSCLFLLVVLFLNDLGLGDSPLVILSLCSLVLFFVISFSCLFVSFSIIFGLPYAFFAWGSFLNIHLSYLYKKRKDCVKWMFTGCCVLSGLQNKMDCSRLVTVACEQIVHGES